MEVYNELKKTAGTVTALNKNECITYVASDGRTKKLVVLPESADQRTAAPRRENCLVEEFASMDIGERKKK